MMQVTNFTAMKTPSLNAQQDRAAGAVLGAFVGDAMGLGPHWYYDLDEQRRDYGDWISGYTDPKPDRYHGGLKAGDSSQAGLILKLTIKSLVAHKGYNQSDFCRRLEEELFPKLDGRTSHGPGGYTSQSIRNAWQKRVVEKRQWGDCAGNADTTECIERALAIAILYAGKPARLVEHVESNMALTQSDETVLALSIAFCSALGLVVTGQRFDEKISDTLEQMVDDGVLPFYRTTHSKHQSPREDGRQPLAGQFSSPDALFMPRWMARTADDPTFIIEPASRISTVYGMPCAIYNLLPTVYYLAARFRGDFESAILHAVNGGGHNQARAMLTGSLVGAQVGLSGIPSWFIDGLNDREELVSLAIRLAEQQA
jgi:ADP-ribosylglycohydrolase